VACRRQTRLWPHGLVAGATASRTRPSGRFLRRAGILGCHCVRRADANKLRRGPAPRPLHMDPAATPASCALATALPAIAPVLAGRKFETGRVRLRRTRSSDDHSRLAYVSSTRDEKPSRHRFLETRTHLLRRATASPLNADDDNGFSILEANRSLRELLDAKGSGTSNPPTGHAPNGKVQRLPPDDGPRMASYGSPRSQPPPQTALPHWLNSYNADRPPLPGTNPRQPRHNVRGRTT